MTGTTTTPSLHAAILAVREEIGAIGKEDTNRAQGWNFRSYQAVINKIAPATLRHGLNIAPRVDDVRYSTLEVGAGEGRRTAGHAVVTVTYTLSCGDDPAAARTVTVPGEAMDFGDKAVSKAMTVAHRTALSQLFQIPFTDADPDHDVYDRGEQRHSVAAPAPKTAGPSWLRRIEAARTIETHLKAVRDDAVADGMADALLADGRTVMAAIKDRKDQIESAHAALTGAMHNERPPVPDAAEFCQDSPGRDLALELLARRGDIDEIVLECYGLPVFQVSTGRLKMLAADRGELMPSTIGADA